MASRTLSVKFSTEGFNEAIASMNRVGASFENALQQAQQSVRQAQQSVKAAAGSALIPENPRAAQQAAKDLESAVKQVNTVVNNAFRELGVKTSQSIENQKQAAISAFNAIKSSGVASAQDVANAQAKLTQKLAELDRQLDQTGESAKETTKEINALAIAGQKAGEGYSIFKNVLANLATSVIQNLASSMQQLAGSVIQVGAQTEKTAVAFETFLGSAEEAKRVMKEVRDFAATTPFELPEVTEAAKQLLATKTPADQLIPTIKMLGEIAAGADKPLSQLLFVYTQIKNQGRALGQDINQLLNAGLSMEDIAKALGKSAKELGQIKGSSEGLQLSFEEVDKVLRSVTSEGGRFFGLMDKLGATTAVKLSNLNDAFTKIYNSIYQGISPALSAVLDIIVQTLDPLGNNQEIWKDLNAQAQSFKDYISQNPGIAKALNQALTSGVKVALQSVTELAKGLLQYLQENPRAIQDAVEAMEGFVKVIGLAVQAMVALGKEINKAGEGWEWMLSPEKRIARQIAESMGEDQAKAYMAAFEAEAKAWEARGMPMWFPGNRQKVAETVAQNFMAQGGGVPDTPGERAMRSSGYGGGNSSGSTGFDFSSIKGTKIVATRTGQKDANGLDILQYSLVKDGKVIDTFIGGSTGQRRTQGDFGKGKTNVAKSMAPPPEGTWKINTAEAKSVLNQNLSGYNQQKLPSGNIGPAWIGLTPTFSTNRSGIGFHLDNITPGSAGCLVFTDPNQIKKIASWVTNSGASDLVVAFDDKYLKNGGQSGSTTTSRPVPTGATQPAKSQSSNQQVSRRDPININASNISQQIQKIPKNQIALTFDDGPDPNWTNKVLDQLKANGMKATFFVVGQRAEKYPEIIRRIVNEGHELGVHSMTHPDFTKITPAQQKKEIEDTLGVLKGIVPDYTPTMFRFPYGAGSYNGQQAYQQRVNQMGLSTAYWSVDTNDWKPSTSAQSIANQILKAGGGDIVLLHDALDARGNAGTTKSKQAVVDALKMALPRLKQQGITSSPLGQILGTSLSAASSTSQSTSALFSNPIAKQIYDTARQLGLDPSTAIAIAAKESGGGNPQNITHLNRRTGKILQSPSTNAYGPFVGSMQVGWGAAVEAGYQKEDRYDPQKNIEIGIRYFQKLLVKFNGDTRKALAAYNAGTGNLSAGYGYADSVLKIKESVEGQIKSSSETLSQLQNAQESLDKIQQEAFNRASTERQQIQKQQLDRLKFQLELDKKQGKLTESQTITQQARIRLQELTFAEENLQAQQADKIRRQKAGERVTDSRNIALELRAIREEKRQVQTMANLDLSLAQRQEPGAYYLDPRMRLPRFGTTTPTIPQFGSQIFGSIFQGSATLEGISKQASTILILDPLKEILTSAVVEASKGLVTSVSQSSLSFPGNLSYQIGEGNLPRFGGPGPAPFGGDFALSLADQQKNVSLELEEVNRRITLAQLEQNAAEVKKLEILREQLALRLTLLEIQQRTDLTTEEKDRAIQQETAISNARVKSLEQVGSLAKELEDIGRGALSTFFENVLSGTQSLSDAFGNMARSILQTVSQLAAQLATVELFKMLGLSTEGLSGANKGGGGGFLGMLGNLFGGLFGFASGGYTGPGSPSQPAGIVHRGEFVLNAAATRNLGPALLASVNQTGRLPVLTMAMESGSGGGSSGGMNVTIQNVYNNPEDRFRRSERSMAREQAEMIRRTIR